MSVCLSPTTCATLTGERLAPLTWYSDSHEDVDDPLGIARQVIGLSPFSILLMHWCFTYTLLLVCMLLKHHNEQYCIQGKFCPQFYFRPFSPPDLRVNLKLG